MNNSIFSFCNANGGRILTAICSFALFFCTSSQTENRSATNKTTRTEFQNPISTDSVVIYWNPPAAPPDSVAYYDLCYRTATQNTWNFIKTQIPATANPHTTLHRTDVAEGDSIFYFAVRAVAKNGSKSDFHTSSDTTAHPPYWYVFWK